MKNILASSVYWVTEADMIDHGEVKFRVFLPESKFKAYWNVLIIFLILYSIILAPYQMAFIDSDLFGLFALEFIVDGVFFADIVLTCFTGFYDKENNLITRHRQIFLNYFKGWFFFDLVACFPIQIILDINYKYYSMVKVTRLQRLSRILRLTKVFRFFKAFSENKQRKYLNLVLKVSVQVERLIWFLWLTLFIIHLIACFWVFIGLFYLDSPENWISSFGFQDYSDLPLYAVSFYWTVTTLTTIGYGDIYPTNSAERVYVFVVMIIGIFMYSSTVSSISNIICALDSRKAKLTKKFDILSHVARKYKITPQFENKIATALQYEHRNSDKELDEILSDLPTAVKLKLLNIIFEQKISKNSFFLGKSAEFTAWIASKLKPLKVENREFIYKETEFASEMYFIVKGSVAVMGKRGNDFYPLIVIQENYYFGEVDLLFSNNKQRLNAVFSENGCELLSLSREFFEEMLTIFEDEAIEICIKARERLDRTNANLESALKEIDSRFEVKALTSIPEKSNIDVQDIKENARRETQRNSILKESSLYKNIIEMKSPENSIGVVKSRIRRMNVCAENITALTNDLFEFFINKAK